MSDEETTTTDGQKAEVVEANPEGTDKIPYERLQKAHTQAKEARAAQKSLEQQVAKLERELEERESAGLPEVEQMKKRLEAAEKRAEESERKATDAEAQVTRGAKERWVTAAAQAQNFADPTDAAAFLSLDEIEDEKDAERAVKRLASSKKHLLKAEEPTLPGRVLENGQPVIRPSNQNGIDPDAEAQMVSDELKKFLASRNG